MSINMSYLPTLPMGGNFIFVCRCGYGAPRLCLIRALTRLAHISRPTRPFPYQSLSHVGRDRTAPRFAPGISHSFFSQKIISLGIRRKSAAPLLFAAVVFLLTSGNFACDFSYRIKNPGMFNSAISHCCYVHLQLWFGVCCDTNLYFPAILG